MRHGMFMMPIHPLDRNPTQTLKEDRETIQLADRLGFYDAFVGEHLTDRAENITNSMLFLATLIDSTKSIKLATGTTNLSQMHPTLVANLAAMMDHLAEGRFIMGISAGALPSDAEALGILGEDRNKIMSDAIDVILAIWERDPPYRIDFPGNRFPVTTEKTYDASLGTGIMYKPYQRPRPEIVGTVVAPYSKGVVLMGQKDFHPLSANFLNEVWLPTHWANYVEGKQSVGITPSIGDWRVARTIFVADDDKTAAAYGQTDPRSPYRFYYSQLFAKLKKGKRHGAFKPSAEMSDDALTLDYVVDSLVIHGSVNRVVDQILALRERIGDFGELVYACLDWVDPKLAKRSMELFASEVMPRVNAAIRAGSATHKSAA